MAKDDVNHVLVRPKRAFYGPPGEAEHDDGIHRPGGRPFRVSRQRRADLMANDLIEDHTPEDIAPVAPPAPPPAPVAEHPLGVPAITSESRPRRPRR